jgi:hypothetical protein
MRRARRLILPGRGSLANWMTSRHLLVLVLLNIGVPFNPNNQVQWSPVGGRIAQLRQLRRPLAVVPVTRGPDKRDLPPMPTFLFQQINSNSSTNNRLLIRDQAQDLFSHRPPPTLLTSVNGPIPSSQRRQHTINLLLQDHNPLSPPRVRRHHSGVMVSQLPLRSVQAGPSHTHQSSNSAQLSLLPSSVHQTTIAMTPIR